MNDADAYKRGMKTRTEMLGQAYVDRATNQATDFNKDFQAFITRYAWNDVWNRPGLERKTRSMLTIAILAGLGREDEFKLHVRSCRNAGVTRDEVKEILMQVAIYAGVPAANTGFRLAREIFEQQDKEEGK
ncbi:MAG: 4-carboxymuconolactone decarboxylase [Alphaproteobacteria bacterium]|nr:4-carboxymuconolactone decarboxylase [Alphaproteobacteria bacterium]